MTNKTVQIAGRDYRIAPLNLDQIRKLVLAAPEGETPLQQQDRVLAMCAASLQNADPSNPGADQLLKLLDLGSMGELVRDVLEVSLLKPSGGASGEPAPAAESGSSASTATS